MERPMSGLAGIIFGCFWRSTATGGRTVLPGRLTGCTVRLQNSVMTSATCSILVMNLRRLPRAWRVFACLGPGVD